MKTLLTVATMVVWLTLMSIAFVAGAGDPGCMKILEVLAAVVVCGSFVALTVWAIHSTAAKWL